MDESFIYEIKNNLPANLCKAIIKKFESSPEHYEHGRVGIFPVNKQWKDSTEIHIEKYEEWRRAYIKLSYFLSLGIKEYREEIKKFVDKTCGIDGDTNFALHFSIGSEHFHRDLNIQKIRKGSRYRWHNDYDDNTPDRVATIMWYLNTLEEDEGGKTAFINGRKVRPEEGKLLIFPSTWSAIHCGELIKAESKYILVGALYRQHMEFKE